MSARYVLAHHSALDLFEIWQVIEERRSLATADHVETVLREKLVFLASLTGGWRHRWSNRTEHNVKFFRLRTHLVIYRPQTNPLQVVWILHGRRDVVQILEDRL